MDSCKRLQLCNQRCYIDQVVVKRSHRIYCLLACCPAENAAAKSCPGYLSNLEQNIFSFFLLGHSGLHLEHGTILLRRRGSNKSKQPAVAVMACIVSGDATSSRSSSPELTGYQGLQGSPASAPAVTPPVPACSNPVWDHCLSCGFAEGELQTGQLQLALMNEADGTVITRQAVVTIS